jgi:hypothetical protein
VTRHFDRWVSPVALACIIVLLATGCSDTGPHAPESKDTAMTLEEARQNVLDVFTTIKSVVGEGGWDTGTESGWNGCSSGGTAGAQFMLTAIRKHTLSASPDDVAHDVAEALASTMELHGVRVHRHRLPERLQRRDRCGRLRVPVPGGSRVRRDDHLRTLRARQAAEARHSAEPGVGRGQHSLMACADFPLLNPRPTGRPRRRTGRADDRDDRLTHVAGGGAATLGG